LINLVQNAQQAMVVPDDIDGCAGKITIGTAVRDGELELRIADNGIGISVENRGKLFKPLFSTKTYGVGLGLPLVRRIVEQHNGRISVASEWQKGTTVTIWLPLALPMPGVENRSGAAAQPRSGAAESDATV
jgi:signal transduction histidine kinase